MSDGGKGSKPRPFSVDADTYDSNWDRIFKKSKDKSASDYQDILSTEDCVLGAFDKLDKEGSNPA